MLKALSRGVYIDRNKKATVRRNPLCDRWSSGGAAEGNGTGTPDAPIKTPKEPPQNLGSSYVGAFASSGKTASALTAIQVIGDHPDGFGKGFTWDRHDNEILLVMFINAADPFGVVVDGLESRDTIQITSCAGIASFSEDTGNPLASSIVGLVAAGASIVLSATGYAGAVPLVCIQ